MTGSKHVFKLRPDIPDPRDFKLHASRRIGDLPKVVDNRKWFSPIRDQGNLGSCSAFAAVGGAFEMLGNKIFIEGLPLEDYTQDFGDKFEQASTLFQYQNTLIVEGCFGQDNGATMRGAVKALAAYGVCREVTWPYDISKFGTRAPKAAYDEAAKHRINVYARLESTLAIKQALAQGLPVILGLMLYESFESEEAFKTGFIKMPDVKRESLLGGHAVCLAGYTETHWIIRNSWGPEFGQKGYCMVPLEYINLKNGLALDPWVITK